MVLERDRAELYDRLGKSLQQILLYLYRFENSFSFKVSHMLLPVLRPTQIRHIGEEQFTLQCKLHIEVFGFHCDLRSKQDDVIDLNFFLAVPDQEGFRYVCLLGYPCRDQ